MPRSLQFFLVFLALTLAQPAFAQDAEYALGEIVVKSEKPTVDDVTNVTEITAKDIETRGATTLNEALLMLPGVYIRTAADGTPRIDIRGFRTRHIKLLVNGVPFQSTYDGQFDPASIPAENIARIVLTKGASSVLYGAGGTAAVINIITKGGEQGMHGSVGLRAGETDSYLGKASLSGANEKGYFYTGVSSLNSNAFDVSGDFDKTDVQDSDSRKNSDHKRNSVFFNGGYNITDKTQLGAVLSYSGGSYGKPPSVVPGSGDDFVKKPKYERLDDYSEVAAQLNLRHEFAAPLTIDTAIYGNQRNELTNLYDDETYSEQKTNNSSKSRAVSTIAGASMHAGYDFGAYGNLALALSGESQGWYEDYTKKPDVSSSTTTSDNDLQEYSSALEYTITPIDPVTLVAGVGYVAQTGPESETATDWTYNLGANYRPIAGTTLFANHARKVRFASVKNLFAADGVGNPDLEPEVAKHYEVGLSQELPFKTVFTGSVYRIDSENLIEKDSGGTYQNYEKYLMQGFEVGLENTFFESFWVKASYNYLHSEDKSDDAIRDELQYRPRDTFAVEAKYTAPFGTAFYSSVYYVANQYTYGVNDESLQYRMPDVTLVNFKVSQAFMDKALNVYAGVDNLFDEDYEESYAYPRPGRTLYCGFDYAF